MDQHTRNALVAERQAGAGEFCSICFGLVGFSKNVTIDDPIRFKNGAMYIEGVGQICSECNKEKPAGVKS